MSAEDVFSLSELGQELNLARRSRLAQPVPMETTQSPSSSSPTSTKRSLSTESSGSRDEAVERPYPLCLLCLERPPSAVLLPCCHLNLCYICAPLLLLKHKSPSQAPSLSSSPEETHALDAPIPASTPLTRCERPSWNTVLARATASHPKSRRLSMGGYTSPDIGTKGGEMSPSNLLSFDDQCGAYRSGLSPSLQDDGRVGLSSHSDKSGCAKCLICRAGVQGWLRVYTG